MHIGKASEGQHLYSWYASLVPTGYAGKMLVMYVHEPSMMTILCPGKTIKTTWPVFRERLEALLSRMGVTQAFEEHEIQQIDGFVVSKTNSRSMLAIVSQLQQDIAWHTRQTHLPYNLFPLDVWENNFMKRLHAAGRKPTDYTTPLEFLHEIKALEV